MEPAPQSVAGRPTPTTPTDVFQFSALFPDYDAQHNPLYASFDLHGVLALRLDDVAVTYLMPVKTQTMALTLGGRATLVPAWYDPVVLEYVRGPDALLLNQLRRIKPNRFGPLFPIKPNCFDCLFPVVYLELRKVFTRGTQYHTYGSPGMALSLNGSFSWGFACRRAERV